MKKVNRTLRANDVVGAVSFMDFVQKKEKRQTLDDGTDVIMDAAFCALIEITQEINTVLKALRVCEDKMNPKELLQVKVRDMCKRSRPEAFLFRYLLELHSGNLSNITKVVREECDKFPYSQADIKEAFRIKEEMEGHEDKRLRYVEFFAEAFIADDEEPSQEVGDQVAAEDGC